jgi:hypothetical protein
MADDHTYPSRAYNWAKLHTYPSRAHNWAELRDAARQIREDHSHAVACLRYLVTQALEGGGDVEDICDNAAIVEEALSAWAWAEIPRGP